MTDPRVRKIIHVNMDDVCIRHQSPGTGRADIHA
jgi:hypothetical protein